MKTLTRILSSTVKLTTILIALLIAVAVALPVRTEKNQAPPEHDWTKFGYDLANTSYTPDPGPRVLYIRWRFPQEPYYLPAEICSWPAVVNGVIYFDIGEGRGGSFENLRNSVVALNAENGDVMWYKKLYASSSSSPAVVDGKVFIGSTDNYVYALNADDGRENWKSETNGVVTSSPAVVDGKVFIGTNDGYMYALSAENGDVTWKRKISGGIFTSPAVADRKIFIMIDNYGRHGFSALNVENGEPVWIYYLDNDWFGSSPTVAYGKVFAVTPKGWVYSVYAENGGLSWKYKMGDEEPYFARSLSAPAAAHGIIYVFKNARRENIQTRKDTLLALNADNGSLVWESSPSRTGLRAIVADNVVFTSWHTGELWMLNARTGDLLKRVNVYDVVDGLSVVGDKLYVATHGGVIMCIGLPKTGAEVEPSEIEPSRTLLWFTALGLLLIFIGILSLYLTKVEHVWRR